MWDDFISGQIRRTSRNLFLLGTAVLTILGLLLAAGWRDTYNFVFGPFPVQGSELVSIWNPAVPKRYFLKVQGEKSFATGMQEVDAGNHDKIRAEIVALVVNKRLLLVKTPADNHQLQFTGTLAAVPMEISNGVVRSSRNILSKRTLFFRSCWMPRASERETTSSWRLSARASASSDLC